MCDTISTASESHPLLIYALSFCCPPSMHILALLRSSHDVVLPMASMLMHTCPDPNHMSLPPPCPGELPHRQQHAMSCPMTTQDVPHSSGCAPAPLTCPAPSQCAIAIPHASHTPFMCLGFTTGIPWVQFSDTVPLPINTVTVAGEGMTPYMFGYGVIPKKLNYYTAHHPVSLTGTFTIPPRSSPPPRP